jgi:hypothetical protein
VHIVEQRFPFMPPHKQVAGTSVPVCADGPAKLAECRAAVICELYAVERQPPRRCSSGTNSGDKRSRRSRKSESQTPTEQDRRPKLAARCRDGTPQRGCQRICVRRWCHRSTFQAQQSHCLHQGHWVGRMGDGTVDCCSAPSCCFSMPSLKEKPNAAIGELRSPRGQPVVARLDGCTRPRTRLGTEPVWPAAQ